jgi:hypothetical protein
MHYLCAYLLLIVLCVDPRNVLFLANHNNVLKSLAGVNLKNKMNEIGIMPKAVSVDFY